MIDKKHFVFMYPIKEYFEQELKGMPQERIEKYTRVLNECIEQRYRNKGFKVSFITFKGSPAYIVEVKKEDRIIEVEVDFKTHIKYNKYPNENNILNKLGNVKILRIAGFHLWDCVQRTAEAAYKKGIEVLIDEDITELLVWRMDRPSFKINKYPNIPKEFNNEYFLENRKGKP